MDEPRHPTPVPTHLTASVTKATIFLQSPEDPLFRAAPRMRHPTSLGTPHGTQVARRVAQIGSPAFAVPPLGQGLSFPSEGDYGGLTGA